ncbi:MAG: crosslink repair DNA glycosylase YcaQ family protein [Solirubrobacterales bacterium]
MAVTITQAQARRLALHAQGLAAPPEPGAGIAEIVERIGCLQLDPVGVVARSPLLVLRARMRGGTHESHSRALDRAAYRDRVLFDYWCHEASLCHVADLPLHRWAMRTYLERLSPARAVVREWLEVNEEFARSTVAALRADGPLRANELEDRSAEAWVHGHWTDEVSSRQTIARMLDRLWMQGEIGVAERHATARRWDLMERCLPPGALAAADAEPIEGAEATRRAALRAVAMLGVARAPQINAHFTRRRYPGLEGALSELELRGELVRVGVKGLRGEWWIRSADLESVADLEPARRTLALSPFDNLICDRARTAELFGFDHRLEIYVPAGKRRWGYYVLPILHGERLIARADLRVDREGEVPVLRLLALHREPGRRADGAIRRALESLAAWRGAELWE